MGDRGKDKGGAEAAARFKQYDYRAVRCMRDAAARGWPGRWRVTGYVSQSCQDGMLRSLASVLYGIFPSATRPRSSALLWWPCHNFMQ
eukprot:364425-Chlamydomonas_euryale.AAC.2